MQQIESIKDAYLYSPTAPSQVGEYSFVGIPAGRSRSMKGFKNGVDKVWDLRKVSHASSSCTKDHWSLSVAMFLPNPQMEYRSNDVLASRALSAAHKLADGEPEPQHNSYVCLEGGPKTAHAMHPEVSKDFVRQHKALSLLVRGAAGSVSVGRGQPGVCRVPLVSNRICGRRPWTAVCSEHRNRQGSSIQRDSRLLLTVSTAIEVARGRSSSAACLGGITKWGTLPVELLCLVCLGLRATPATAWRSRSAAGLRDSGRRGATSRSFPQTCQAADLEAFHKGLGLGGI